MVEQKPACGVLSQQFEFEPIKQAAAVAQREGADGEAAVRPAPRLRLANRTQLRLQAWDLDSCLAADHAARAIWRLLEQVDLAAYYQSIKAVEGEPGRNMTDPKILLALWLYAISEGVSSAHEVDRQCQAHDAYRWICGGVSVDYHMINDFRKANPKALDELFTQVLAVLMHRGLVSLKRVAQDGMRVRASAGAASFRRQPKLEQCLAKAQAQVEALKAEAAENDTQRSARIKKARERAARERQQRLEQAIKELAVVQATKAQAKNHPQRKTECRASTTDPEARVMKMANGGYNPAYNLQFSTDTVSRIIVGVQATNAGTDNHQLDPMLDNIEGRVERLPGQALLDGGYMNFAALEKAAARGVEVLAPPRANKDYHIDPCTPQHGDTPVIAAYRQRMASPEGKEIYKQRAAVAETVHADLRTWRGLDRLLVRGSAKVLMVTVWSALTYNILRAFKMGWL